MTARGESTMLTRLFPRQIDNDYQGWRLAIWLLVPLALVKLLQGANVAGLFGPGNSRQILEGVDKVPLGAFPAERYPTSSSCSRRGGSASSSWASSRSWCSSATAG
jgi:hypothetical protein